MINALVAIVVIALILISSEFLWRKAHLRGEFARKFVHIIAGSFIAFFPFWISYGWIDLLAVGFIVANLLNRYTPLFHAIHSVTRKSWGEILFGIGILVVSLFRPNRWLFTGAILQVALADGLAAVVGAHYGKHPYKILDHKKTVIGTITFLACSITIACLVVYFGRLKLGFDGAVVYLALPLFLTLVENISGYGSDNATLPIAFLLVMRFLKV